MKPIEKLKVSHNYILTNLYKAQARGESEFQNEDYWRGAFKGIEQALDTLGIDHEEYDPLGYLKYDEYNQEA